MNTMKSSTYRALSIVKVFDDAINFYSGCFQVGSLFLGRGDQRE